VKDVFAKKFFGAGRDSARGARSNFDEATSDRLALLGERTSSWVFANCVASVSTRRCLIMACSPPAARIFQHAPRAIPADICSLRWSGP